MDTPPPPKLLDQMRDALRLKHYSYRTEQTYLAWAERYIRFHHLRHPKDMGAPEINACLTHLAVRRPLDQTKTGQPSGQPRVRVRNLQLLITNYQLPTISPAASTPPSTPNYPNARPI